MAKNHFVSGGWNVTCDVCSRKIKASEAKLRWDGFIVCSEDYEHRHPQDFVKAQSDKITVPFVRPIPEEIFVFVCTSFSSQGRADMGQANCARANYIADISDYCTILGSSAITGIAISGCSISGKNI